jgi:hypothetical protein
MFAEERKQRHFVVAECKPLDCPGFHAKLKIVGWLAEATG